MTVATAIDRLNNKKASLAEEVSRITSSRDMELALLRDQFQAVNRALAALTDPNLSTPIDKLLSTLAQAGVRLEIVN